MADNLHLNVRNEQYQYITPAFSLVQQWDNEEEFKQNELAPQDQIRKNDLESLLGQDRARSLSGQQRSISGSKFTERFGQDRTQLESSLSTAYSNAYRGHSSIWKKSKRAESAAKKIEIQKALDWELNSFEKQREATQLTLLKHMTQNDVNILDARFRTDAQKEALREWMIVKAGDNHQDYRNWTQKLNAGLFSDDNEKYISALKNALYVCENENLEGLAYTNDEEFIERYAEKYGTICQIASGEVMLQKYIEAKGEGSGLNLNKILANIERAQNLKAEYENRMQMISSPYYAIVERKDIEEYLDVDGEEKLLVAEHKDTMESGLINYIRTIRKIESPSWVRPMTIGSLLSHFRKDKRAEHVDIKDRDWNIQKATDFFDVTLTGTNDLIYSFFRKNTAWNSYMDFMHDFLYRQDKFSSAADVEKLIDQLAMPENIKRMPNFNEIGDQDVNTNAKTRFLKKFKEYIRSTDRLTHEIVLPNYQFYKPGDANAMPADKQLLVMGYENSEHTQFNLKNWTNTLKDFVKSTKSADEQNKYQQYFNLEKQEMRKWNELVENNNNGNTLQHPMIKMKMYNSAGKAYCDRGEDVLEFDLAGTGDDTLSRGVNIRKEQPEYTTEIKQNEYKKNKYGETVVGFEHVTKAVHTNDNGTNRTRYNMGGPTLFNGGENSMQNVEQRILDFGSEWLTPILEDMRSDLAKRKDVHIILTGLSRGAAATTAGVMRLSKWVHDNYAEFANYVKIDVVLHDPTPGFGSRSGIYEKADLSSEQSYNKSGKPTENDARKVYRGVGKNISSTVFYSLKSGGKFARMFLDPQKVMGADRVIISPYEHVKTYEVGREEVGNHYRKRPFIDPLTDAAYRGSGINALPKGFYFADEKNVLVRIDTYDQYVNLMERLLKDVWRDVLRTDVINDVAKNFFNR